MIVKANLEDQEILQKNQQQQKKQNSHDIKDLQEGLADCSTVQTCLHLNMICMESSERNLVTSSQKSMSDVCKTISRLARGILETCAVD